MALTLGELLTAEMLSDLAGDPTFPRGAEYVEHGRVLGLSVLAGGIRARVRGTKVYEVRLWIEGAEFRHSCDCPAAEDGFICKHVVAAGLYWLAKQEVNEFAQRRDAKPGPVRAFLKSLDKPKLIDLLIEHARLDERLELRLRSIAATDRGPTPDLPELRKLITSAARVRSSMKYHETRAFARKLDEAVDVIQTLINDGHASMAVELAEHAIDKVEHTIEHVDDSDGDVGNILRRAQELHLAACRDACPDPVALAGRLFEKEIGSHWDVFHRAAFVYRSVLGERGLTEYRRLAAPIWERIPRLEPGQEDDPEIERRFAITSMMEALAEAAGDPDEWTSVVSRDLSCTHQFLRIAEKHREAGRTDSALQWAERGSRSFPDARDQRLQEFEAEVHAQEGRHEVAVATIWATFEAAPFPEHYLLLKAYAERAGQAGTWRDRALQLLRGKIAGSASPKPRKDTRGKQPSPIADFLVRILILEGLVDDAWSTASEHGCALRTWLELARLREQEHPADVIPVFRRHFEETVEQRNNGAYDQAVDVLRRIQKLARRSGTEGEFALMLEDVRKAHKAKRNFMQRLEKVRWT